MTTPQNAATRGTRPPHRHTLLRRGSVALLVCLSLVGPAVLAQAAGRDDLLRQQQENDERRETLESDMEGLDEDIVEAHIALEDARAQVPGAEAALADAQAELAAAARVQEQVTGRLAVADAQAAALEAEIAASAEQIAGYRDAMGELARSSYRGENATTTISMVLAASTSEDFLRGYAVMETAARAQTQALRDLENGAAVAANQRVRQDAVAERVGELKAEADVAVAAADAARAAAQERATAVRELEAEMSALSASLEERKGDVTEQIAGLRAENDALTAEIAAIDEANRRAEEERRRAEDEERRRREEAARTAPAAPAPAPVAPAAPAPAGNLLVPPVPNPLYVTSGYGMRWYPITGGNWMHLGVDIRSRCGNPQVAAAGGTVVSTKPPWATGTSGNQVIVNHGVIGGNSYVTVYNHLSGFAVSPGQQVAQGQTIGWTGDTGRVTGCHVHFEVWKNGKTLDPMGLPGFVRSN